MAEKERQLQIKASQDMVTALEAQKKALEERTNLVMDMIKKEQELRKKAINEEIDGYEKIIEARKKSITDEQDDASYNEELSDKQKVVTDLESKLLALQNDNSESAKAQRLKLEEELSTAKKDLNKLQLDKQTDDRLDALDEELESFKDEKQEELDEIEDYLSKEGQIRSDAMKRIEQEGKSLYNSLKAYNSEYGVKSDSPLCTEMCIEKHTYMQVTPKAIHHNISMRYDLYDGTKVEKNVWMNIRLNPKYSVMFKLS